MKSLSKEKQSLTTQSEGLPSGRVMDPEYFGQMLPHYIRDFGKGEAVCGAFGLGQMGRLLGYNGGVVVAEFMHGRGRILLNSFRLLNGIGTNPAAERILLNIARAYGR